MTDFARTKGILAEPPDPALSPCELVRLAAAQAAAQRGERVAGESPIVAAARQAAARTRSSGQF